MLAYLHPFRQAKKQVRPALFPSCSTAAICTLVDLLTSRFSVSGREC